MSISEYESVTVPGIGNGFDTDIGERNDNRDNAGDFGCQSARSGVVWSMLVTSRVVRFGHGVLARDADEAMLIAGVFIPGQVAGRRSCDLVNKWPCKEN
jgi:hypothetical protein